MANTHVVTNKNVGIKIAVIGVGGWGKNHVRVLHNMGVLEAVCDLSADRAKEIAKKYDTKFYSSIKDLFSNERGLNACLVCTPTKSQGRQFKMVVIYLWKNLFHFHQKNVRR